MPQANFTTSKSVNTPIAGIGSGDSIAYLFFALVQVGVDDVGHSDLSVAANLAWAVNQAINATPSRCFTNSDPTNIAQFQTIGGVTLDISNMNLVNGATYVPVVQVTENMAGGLGPQSGPYTKGAPVVYNAGTGLTAVWTVSQAGSGSVTVNGDNTVSVMDSTGASGAAALYYLTSGVAAAQAKTYKMKFQALGIIGGVCLGIGAGVPVVGAVATVTAAGAWWNNSRGMSVWNDGSNAYCRALVGTNSGTEVWTQRTGGWVGGTAGGSIDWANDGKFALALNTTYTAVMTTTSTGVSFALKSADESTTIFQTTEVSWSSWMASPPATVYPLAGDPYTDASYGANIKLVSWSVQ